MSEGTVMVSDAPSCRWVSGAGVACDNVFKYGDIVVRIDQVGAVCEKCARTGKVGKVLDAVVFGGGKPNSVARDRGRKNLKKLQRIFGRAGPVEPKAD